MNTNVDLQTLIDHLIERVARRMIDLQRQAQPADEAQSPWMSIAKTADYLDWPRQRLYKLTASGAIPHYKHEGRLLFHRSELDRWLAQHAQPVSGLACLLEESYPSRATAHEMTRRATTRRSPQ
jgi:excisionase family DNA binding protein